MFMQPPTLDYGKSPAPPSSGRRWLRVSLALSGGALVLVVIVAIVAIALVVLLLYLALKLMEFVAPML